MKLGKNEIEIGRQGNFIFALLLIHFAFYGFLSNIFIKEVGENGIAYLRILAGTNAISADSILFLYKIFFHPVSFISIFILFGIVFLMTFRENFFEYGIRNSIWLTPFIIIESWIWYWFIAGFDITLLGWYFIRIESYLTILLILGIVLCAAITSAIAKLKYQRYLRKARAIEA